MKRLTILLVLLVLIIISAFAFTACNYNEYNPTDTILESDAIFCENESCDYGCENENERGLVLTASLRTLLSSATTTASVITIITLSSYIIALGFQYIQSRRLKIPARLTHYTISDYNEVLLQVVFGLLLSFVPFAFINFISEDFDKFPTIVIILALISISFLACVRINPNKWYGHKQEYVRKLWLAIPWAVFNLAYIALLFEISNPIIFMLITFTILAHWIFSLIMVLISITYRSAISGKHLITLKNGNSFMLAARYSSDSWILMPCELSIERKGKSKDAATTQCQINVTPGIYDISSIKKLKVKEINAVVNIKSSTKK